MWIYSSPRVCSKIAIFEQVDDRSTPNFRPERLLDLPTLFRLEIRLSLSWGPEGNGTRNGHKPK